MKTQLRNLTVSLLGALVLFGCSEQSTTSSTGPDESQAPILPPAQSLAFDMSFFDNDQNRQILADTEQGRMGAYDTHWHWLQAVGRVIILNASVAEAMFAPHLAFALAIHTVPSDLGDNTWMWIYTWVDPDGREIQIRLRGQVLADVVAWELRVSDTDATPPLEQVLWFSGESNLDGTGGFWIFQDLEFDPEAEVARVDWTVAAEDLAELSFENIRFGDDEFGDTLTYRVVRDIVTIEFLDASDPAIWDITWNEETGAGSLQVPEYNDGERACWDEQQRDTECDDIEI